jgi:hypothetical protein
MFNEFVKEETTFYSHSEDYLPIDATQSVTLDQWPRVPMSDFSDPGRPPTITDATAYVGFMPVDLPTDKFLGFLRWGSKPPIKLENDPNGVKRWIIEPIYEKMISELDHRLRLTLHVLFKGDPTSYRVVGQRLWVRCPANYLESKYYVNPREATKALNNARSAFYPLFGML